jgi:hypothetical protein
MKLKNRTWVASVVVAAVVLIGAVGSGGGEEVCARRAYRSHEDG